MVDPTDLQVGGTYFMVTYPEPTMTTPIILTYRYLGRDPEGVQQDEPGSRYYFRYLPAFRPGTEDVEAARDASGWESVFPGAFSGWGEDVPHSLPETNLLGLVTFDGLIEELNAIRTRTRKQ